MEFENEEVAVCVDIDLNFSSSTNLLPIRRLDLAIGQDAELTAAWLVSPISPSSRSPRFTAELETLFININHPAVPTPPA